VENKERLRLLLRSASALLDAMRYSAATASGEAANIGRYTSYRTFARKYNLLVKAAVPFLADPTILGLYDLAKLKRSGELTWIDQKEVFDQVYSDLALLKSLLEGEIGFAEDEAQNLRDFIQGNLRRAVFGTPEKELEVQNAIKALIVGRGMAKGTDYDREAGRVKTSGKESIPDFIFPRLNLSLEVKLSNSSDKLRAIIDEVNSDIRAYGTRYKRQFYIIYDIGTIRDEAEFKRGLEDAFGVSVLIVKH